MGEMTREQRDGLTMHLLRCWHDRLKTDNIGLDYAEAAMLQLILRKQAQECMNDGSLSKRDFLEAEEFARFMAEQIWPEPKLERKVPCGVSVVIQNNDGRVLMGKRKGAHGAGTWAFPGGWLEHGENFQICAEREVLEETGLKLNGPVQVISAINSIFQEGIHSVTVMLLAFKWEGQSQALEPHKLEGEWQWVDPQNPPQPLFEPVVEGMRHLVNWSTS